MGKEKLIECTVVRSGHVVDGEELAIGDTLDLTEQQIVSLSGKVETTGAIKAKAKADEMSPKGIKKLQATIKTQEARIEELEEAAVANEAALAAKVEHIAKLEEAAKKAPAPGK